MFARLAPASRQITLLRPCVAPLRVLGRLLAPVGIACATRLASSLALRQPSALLLRGPCAMPLSTAVVGAQCLVARPASLLQLLAGACRWKSRPGNHKLGGSRAAPKRKGVKLKRNPGNIKLKSHKGALKRFYQRGDGTFMHKACGKKHLQAGTSRRRQTLRKLKHRPVTAKGIIKKLRRLMPYGTTLQPKPRFKVSVLWERPVDWHEKVAAAMAAAQAAAAGKAKPKTKAKKQAA